MKFRSCSAIFCVLFLGVLTLIPVVGESQSNGRAPTDDEIRAKQEVGRAIISPDGQTFFYEWTRPYNWDRDFGSLPPDIAKHMQTWLYKVDVNQSPVNSDYIFYPDSGASYWLGSLSPNAKKISFYVLNEDNTLQAGVWNLGNSKLTLFNIPPDPKRLDTTPVWVSDTEVVYPASAAKWVRGNLTTGHATACSNCSSVAEKSRHSINKAAAGLEPDTRLLAKSRKGDLAVYAKDTPDVLELMFKKGDGEPQSVFENKRHN